MEPERSESLTFSYSDIFFSYYFDKERYCRPMVFDHTLVYVYSGEFILQEKSKRTVVRKGECVFLKKDNRVNMTKQPLFDKEEPFRAIFMKFKRSFLRDFYQTLDKSKIPTEVIKKNVSVVKLSQSPDVTSLFQSMVPYFDSAIKPADEMMNLKVQEGIITLLHMDKVFYQYLFDFTEPWKIDILDFMNNNYMYELSIEEIANFTGRSLATFKRDFKKISSTSPQKWLIEKRLSVAYDKINDENKKVSDVYLEVGFKNLSHFSKAYKEAFGHAPSKLV
ncbi:helix-turn-helix transcriptional regulator [Dysgonomonas sp. HDW5A]|uniref:helix-turn-helix domain-containing protein n=1 Tax=unclassified Dysgonomonas TaxID=2630389 RepID=UPI00140E0B8A|nr:MULTISPECIES: AraC family transcriptional regulator [unclassified Dysgonomonas]QIK55518.1 helix-turn-helix transcriptional regulator [Dysgonomonas sp. HDW5B]QIK60935.1 helix-turn-helix transcriptional regulator [Dysgonomonas sp. HDW5A]